MRRRGGWWGDLGDRLMCSSQSPVRWGISVTVYGGVNKNPQIRALRKGSELVVACPGRLLDLQRRRHLSLDSVTFLVIVASGLVLLLGTWVIVDRVVARPLRNVVRGAQRVADGDYGRRLTVNRQRQNTLKMID